MIKTLHVLEYAHDPAYRRTIHHLLSRGERRNSLARDVFHGQRGQLRRHYQAGQENQLGSLVIWRGESLSGTCGHRGRAAVAEGYPVAASFVSDARYVHSRDRLLQGRAGGVRARRVGVMGGGADGRLHLARGGGGLSGGASGDGPVTQHRACLCRAGSAVSVLRRCARAALVPAWSGGPGWVLAVAGGRTAACSRPVTERRAAVPVEEGGERGDDHGVWLLAVRRPARLGAHGGGRPAVGTQVSGVPAAGLRRWRARPVPHGSRQDDQVQGGRRGL